MTFMNLNGPSDDCGSSLTWSWDDFTVNFSKWVAFFTAWWTDRKQHLGWLRFL